MLQATTIADSLFTKTQQKVMGLLFRKPDTSFYLNEIVRLADMGKGTIKRELEKMTQAGLLTVKRIGNQTHYQANPASPVYDELISISRKTFGLADVIRQALQADGSFLAEGSFQADGSIQYAFIYGSIAKGEDTAQSDIDLMIIGDDLAYTDMMNILIPIEKELQCPINPSIYTLEDFKKKRDEKNSFIIRVLEQEKINVIGDADAIR
ncbi:MAG: nucleotidyltransferase domain-containing protein [Cocleimonas sp.]